MKESDAHTRREFVTIQLLHFSLGARKDTSWSWGAREVKRLSAQPRVESRLKQSLESTSQSCWMDTYVVEQNIR